MESLSSEKPRPHPADVVWALASDGHWHDSIDLERRVSYEPKTVSMAIDFLAKYGFLEPSPTTGKFKVIAESAPPTQVLDCLLQMVWTGQAK